MPHDGYNDLTLPTPEEAKILWTALEMAEFKRGDIEFSPDRRNAKFYQLLCHDILECLSYYMDIRGDWRGYETLNYFDPSNIHTEWAERIDREITEPFATVLRHGSQIQSIYFRNIEYENKLSAYMVVKNLLLMYRNVPLKHKIKIQNLVSFRLGINVD